MKVFGKCWLCLALAIAMMAGLGEAAGGAYLAEGTRITIQLNDYLSTKLNNEGDTFTAVVANAVYQGNSVIIPKGSTVTGSVSRILRPGRFRGKAVINLIFHSIRIPGGGEMAIVASLSGVDSGVGRVIPTEGTLEGQGSAGKDAARVLKPGLVGAGIGSLAGGSKGAAVGAGVGAAVGVGTVFATRGKDLEVHPGTVMEISLDRPLSIPDESESSQGKNRPFAPVPVR